MTERTAGTLAKIVHWTVGIVVVVGVSISILVVVLCLTGGC